MRDDHLSIIYERYRGTPTVTVKSSDEVLVNRYLSKVLSTDELRGKTVLEIGAGCSQYARLFLTYGCTAYYANDLIPARLELTRLADPRYRELPGDFLAVQIPEKVDLIFANLTMMFLVPFFDQFAKKISASLAPGGIFVSMDSNYYCPLNVVRRFSDRKANPARLFSPHDFAARFERNGLAIEALRPFTARFPWTTGNWLFGTNFWLKARKPSE